MSDFERWWQSQAKMPENAVDAIGSDEHLKQCCLRAWNAGLEKYDEVLRRKNREIAELIDERI